MSMTITVAVGAVILLLAAGGALTKIGPWYRGLKKPSWNPPGWLFPIMWLIVSKPTQFAAVYKLVTQSYEKRSTLSLSIPWIHPRKISIGYPFNQR